MPGFQYLFKADEAEQILSFLQDRVVGSERTGIANAPRLAANGIRPLEYWAAGHLAWLCPRGNRRAT